MGTTTDFLHCSQCKAILWDKVIAEDEAVLLLKCILLRGLALKRRRTMAL